MRIATVTSRSTAIQPSYRLSFTDGRQVIVAEEHSLLTDGKNTNWKRARYLEPGREIRDLGIPWVTGISWEHGWLAGAFDGEASLSSASVYGGWFIVFPQLPGAVMDLAERLLKQFKFETRWDHPGRDEHGELRDVQRLAVTGIYDCFRFLGECRPVRLIGRSRPWIEGHSSARSRGSLRNRRYGAALHDVEYIGLHEVVVLETDSRTMFAEGLFMGAGVTHKSRAMPSTMRV
jgi:hypothetical protein